MCLPRQRRSGGKLDQAFVRKSGNLAGDAKGKDTAAKAVAEAQVANVLVGTRVETIAARKIGWRPAAQQQFGLFELRERGAQYLAQSARLSAGGDNREVESADAPERGGLPRISDDAG